MNKASLALCFLLLTSVHTASAAPWAEVGDAQLRSDIELLAAKGVLDNLTTQWPIPWGRMLDRLEADGALDHQPAYVVEAAERVRQEAALEMTADSDSASATADATNAPELVRGFDALGLQDVQGQAQISWNGSDATAARLAAGVQTHDRFDGQTLVLDNTFIAHQFGNTAAYAGYLTHWWGPGWISALSESNNARPPPQVGISRINPDAFKTPWLAWIGPWQAEFFFGLLNGPAVTPHRFIDGLRFGFNPAPGLEIGLARLDMLCGRGHPCDPIVTYFDLRNDTSHSSKTADEGNIDVKYDGSIGGLPYSAYFQLMNEDSNPIIHSGTSHLVGLTSWLPVGRTRVRLTAEFTDTVSTLNAFSFGNYIYGFSYNDYKYPDGTRYRGRALGFSLDDDSKLATLQASWQGPHAVAYTLAYHHADIGSVGVPLYAVSGFPPSPITSAPIAVNIGEARVSFALSRWKIDAEARYQDDQPRPAHGGEAAFELRVTYSL